MRKKCKAYKEEYCLKTLNQNETVEKLRKQTIKSIMDVIMLTELKNGAMSGYDVIEYIQTKFGVLLSSGTIYSHLYALERDGLIKGKLHKKKRVYELTEKGEETLETISNENRLLLDTLQMALTS
jgi:DNA-binding PadR family transcriptional regulator